MAACLVGRFEVQAAVSRLSVVGEWQGWDLSRALQLRHDGEAQGSDQTQTWVSEPLNLPLSAFPLKFRLVANGHRHSPNARPLVWDSETRCVPAPPPDGVVRCKFAPTRDNSDSGLVHPFGVGAFQLRLGQLPGSRVPLVQLDASLDQPHRIELFEATAEGSGHAFAELSSTDVGLGPISEGDPVSQDSATTFLLNAQTLNALAFRVDVLSAADASLLARCFVPWQALAPLEGAVSAALVTPDLRPAGTFHAAFLVVTALDHPANTLGGLQRGRWAPHAPTLDIGHRGSGASRVQGHSVRENTLLSFEKAALNLADFVEFDVHLSRDGAVVVHHDFEVKLALGGEEVRVPVSSLRLSTLQSPQLAAFMVDMLTPEEHTQRPALENQRSRLNHTLKRTMTSGEDMYRSVFKPRMSASPEVHGVLEARAFLSDQVASLRDTFRRAPPALGFNIELKYPSAEELAAMSARFASRSHFVDAVLTVVLEEGGARRVIFSTFDPDCAALLSLKQPRYPVLFLTCGGTKAFLDPRMNSLDAALQFAAASHLQGVVAEVTSVLGNLAERVAEFHRVGLLLFTWGLGNNELRHYEAQRKAGVDGIILDDVARIARATNKKQELAVFAAKPIKSPASLLDLRADPATSGLCLSELEDCLPSSLSSMSLGSPAGGSSLATLLAAAN